MRRQIDHALPVVQNGGAARTDLLRTEMDNMTALIVTLACWDYDRTRPLIDGRIRPQEIDLEQRRARARGEFGPGMTRGSLQELRGQEETRV
jgi:hypothetical protein